MDNNHTVYLTAKDLCRICNSQTMIALCIHVWKHFSDIFQELATNKGKLHEKQQIKYCFEQIKRYLQITGDLAREEVTSVIILEIHKLIFVSYKNNERNRIINIVFNDMSIKEIGILEPDIIIDFLFDLIIEVMVHFKSNPNSSLADDHTVDYCWNNMAEIESVMRQNVDKVHPFNATSPKEIYTSCLATLSITHEPIPTRLVKVRHGMDVYNIGRDDSVKDQSPIVTHLE